MLSAAMYTSISHFSFFAAVSFSAAVTVSLVVVLTALSLSIRSARLVVVSLRAATSCLRLESIKCIVESCFSRPAIFSVLKLACLPSSVTSCCSVASISVMLAICFSSLESCCCRLAAAVESVLSDSSSLATFSLRFSSWSFRAPIEPASFCSSTLVLANTLSILLSISSIEVCVFLSTVSMLDSKLVSFLLMESTRTATSSSLWRVSFTMARRPLFASSIPATRMDNVSTFLYSI